jgi:hypothetical protein
MENNGGSNKPKVFAAKYSYKWQGWLLVFLSFGVSGGFQSNGNIAVAIFGSIVSISMLASGIYLLRGEGQSPAQIEKAQRKADALEESIAEATEILKDAKGGEAVVAYRNLIELLDSTKLPNVSERRKEILSSINFDKAKIKSEEIGTIHVYGPQIRSYELEVYKDWVINGQRAWDIDDTTYGEVHLDGTIQFDAKGNEQDMRTASIQFVSKDWAETFEILPDEVAKARRIVSQLAVVANSRRPAAVSGQEVKALLDAILAQNSQPAAEKLKQLSDLRYQRLLSDEEFEAAKAKVLGI